MGAPASSSRAIAGLINRHQRPTSTTTPRSPGSSRSSGSQDSGLTVILDSPAMVFQPGEGSREGSSGGREGREYWTRERGELGELYTRENSRDSYWSRENRWEMITGGASLAICPVQRNLRDFGMLSPYDDKPGSPTHLGSC